MNDYTRFFSKVMVIVIFAAQSRGAIALEVIAIL